MGLEGESLTDEQVWIVKTHFPERAGAYEFHANKVIVVVRNPLDCIASLFNMVGTGTHSESISKEEMDLMIANGIWDKFVC